MNCLEFSAGAGRRHLSSPSFEQRLYSKAAILCGLFVLAGLLALGTGCGGGGTAPVDQSGGDNPPPPPPQNHFAIATYHNDNARSGINSQETKLTLANVNQVSFGRLAAIPVQGAVFAQPLYISNVTMADQKAHNLVIVATEHDQVYAIDGDTYQILWNRSLLDSQGLITSVPGEDVNDHPFNSEVGITGTPVIDPASETVYLVGATKDTGSDQYFQKIYALRLTDGQDSVAPTVITTPSGSQYGSAEFDPRYSFQRSSLLLVNNTVYVAWASQCECRAGWLMGFSATTLQMNSAWTPDPSGLLGGIWMAGGGPSADSNGNIFLGVGNGWSDASSGGPNYGDSVVKLNESGMQMGVEDYFMPYDYDKLYNEDLDMGSGTPLLFPGQPGAAHPNLMVTGGKEGTIYLLDRDNMGKWHANDDGQVVQTFTFDQTGVFNTPIFWNNTLYYGLTQLPVQAFAYDPTTQTVNTTPLSSSPTNMHFPGVSPSLSSNNGNDAILWALENPHGNAILHAYDAKDLSNELYNSEMSSDRDHAGVSTRFSSATVADGQVFVGAQNELDIYGLLNN